MRRFTIIALLLAGIGFVVLAYVGSLRKRETEAPALAGVPEGTEKPLHA